MKSVLCVLPRLGLVLLLLAGCSGRELSLAESDSSSTSNDATAETSTSSTLPTDATSSDDDSTTDPFERLDMGTSPTFQCSVWIQDCAPGHKCTYGSQGGVTWDSTQCVPIAPDPAGVDEPCVVAEHRASGFDDCDWGAMCWYIDAETLAGTCVPICQGTESMPECHDGRACPISGGSVVLLCLPRCDPLEQDCGPDRICTTMAHHFVCVPDHSAGGGGYGEPCDSAYVCASGLFCAPAAGVPGCQGASGCCSEFCNLADPQPCAGEAGGQECVPWYERGKGPPEYQDVGACMIPN
jgi:hypothetical protein